MNASDNDCMPINFTDRLIYRPEDLTSAKELLMLSYPNKDDTFGNWGHLEKGWVIAFYVHVAIFGVTYFALATISLLVLIQRDFQGREVLKKELNHKIVYTLACINVLLIVLGYSKVLFLALDPYFISGYLDCEYCHIPWSLMESLALPSLTIAYTMEFFTLWLCVQIVQDSVLNKCRFVVPFSFLNYAIVIFVQIISNLFVYPAIIIIIACAIYFICFGVIVCFIYILTGWRVLVIINKTARRSATFTSERPRDNEPGIDGAADAVSTARKLSNYTYRERFTKVQKSAIMKISKICFGTAFLGLLLSAVQIVLLVILARVLLTDCISSSHADKNLWLIFQYLREIVELAMGIVLLYCTANFEKLTKWMKKLCIKQQGPF